MSRYVKVSSGEYKLKVEDGSNIVLDTSGSVVVTGNLVVSGEVTTVDTTNMSIQDNLIDLNNGETGAGVTGPNGEQYAGFRIDRGSLEDSFLVFDETENWYDPLTGTIQNGLWAFRYNTGVPIGIKTNSIDTGGGDLGLINAGTGVITVTGTNNYEDQVVDDDVIPNKKYVDDTIQNVIISTYQDKIEENDTRIEVSDFETTGSISVADIFVNNINVAKFADNFVDIFDIRFTENKIESTKSNDDLTLSAPGVGTVKVDDVLSIVKTPNPEDPRLEPDPVTGEVKIYSRAQGPGGTGLYFVNDEDTRDELVSKSKAILYGLIF